jgi:polyisoprenyl-teichoic acid--peptidoglycan teichoic acid transferase
VTEVAPHVGRRARREAENGYASQHTPGTQAPYGTPRASHGSHAAGPPAPVPDTSVFAPRSAPPEPQTGYLPPVRPQQAPQSGAGWHPDANNFAPSGAYVPAADPAPAPPRRPERQPATAYSPQQAAPPHGRAYPASAPPPAGPAAPSRGGYGGGPGGSGGAGGPDGGAPMRGRHATEWGQGFERVVGWTLLGSLLPGAGLIAAGRRTLGWAVAGLCLLLALSGVAIALLTDPVRLVARVLLSSPERLTYLAIAIVLAGVLWGAHVVATTVSLRRFASLSGMQSALSWMLVTCIVGGGVATAVVQAQDVRLLDDTLGSVFEGDKDGTFTSGKKPDVTKADPWANTNRVNTLLIGSDAGADRTGVRTDTLILASTDTKTGRTVLFSLPRNLEKVPFPPDSQQAIDYPEGFSCGDHACMINALWQFGVEHKSQYYKGDKNPGLTATKQGVEQALGLTIDQYAMVDLRGFMQFVDAVGGLEINVPRRIPVGGHRDPDTHREVGVTSYIEPGRQHLDGYRTLWFARSRSDSDDFERMRRQRCVIGALSTQVDPQTVALHITDILKAAKKNIRTSISTSQLEAWVTLAMRVQKGGVQSVTFTDKVIAPGDPDFDVMHEMVQTALTAPPKASPTAKPSASASPKPTGKATNSRKPKASPTIKENGQAVDVKAVC